MTECRLKRGAFLMLVVCFYFIVFASAVLLTGTFFYRNKRVDVNMVMLMLSILCDSLGRYLISVSDNLGQAVWANQMAYVGACFTPFFLVLIMAKLCDVNIPGIITSLWGAVSTFIAVLTMTIGHSTIYYKSVALANGGGFSYLEKEYGPLHILFPLLTAVDAIFMLVIVAKAFRRKNKIPFITVLSICGLCVTVIVIYILSRLLHSKVEWMSIAYLATIIVFMQLFEHISMYDMLTNIGTSVERMREYGFIVFDKKQRFINANDLVRSYFPEINEFKTELAVERSDTPFYREVMVWYNAWCEGNRKVKIIRINDLYLELSVRDIVYGKHERKVGDLVEIIDRTAEHRYTAKVENYNAELSADVMKKTAHINEIKDKMVIGMAAMVESRDNSTGGHIQRTSEVVSMFAAKLSDYAERFGIDYEFIGMVIRAAPMHDLGKISVNDAILCKKGKFTNEEYDIMKKHSEEGAKIVRRILEGVEEERFVQVAENVAHYHHEKWNGTGYPCGLAGDKIPIEARIMALADVFDALVSKRCYKEPFSYDEAFRIIEDNLGTHFDPELGKIFIECRGDLESLYEAMK